MSVFCIYMCSFVTRFEYLSFLQRVWGKIEIMVTTGIVDDFIPCFHCTCAEMAICEIPFNDLTSTTQFGDPNVLYERVILSTDIHFPAFFTWLSSCLCRNGGILNSVLKCDTN